MMTPANALNFMRFNPVVDNTVLRTVTVSTCNFSLSLKKKTSTVLVVRGQQTCRLAKNIKMNCHVKGGAQHWVKD